MSLNDITIEKTVGDSIGLSLLKKNEGKPEENSFSNFELHEMRTEVAKDDRKLIQLSIPLNDSPSAGLGLSLMAQKIYNEGVAVDSGLYIKSVCFFYYYTNYNLKE